MVDKTTPRLGLPQPYLTNPLKIDVGKLSQALAMIDSNAVMLTDWDITADSWQKMGTLKGLGQGKIAASLMVVTGTGFANIIFQTGDGSATTVGDPARIMVTAQTNLGSNSATVLGGVIKETAEDEYEIWFNIAPSTAPRKWSGLLIAGNGATIDWTHSTGAQPTGGVNLNIARSLTETDIASDVRTALGTVLTTGHIGAGVVQLDYLTTVDLKGRPWKTNELVRVKKADATDANGFPPALVSADASATGWFIRCLSINETHSVRDFEFSTEGAATQKTFRSRLSGSTWSSARVYTSSDKPTANDLNVFGIRAAVIAPDIVNLNDFVGAAFLGATAIKNPTTAVAANNFPFNELGTILVFPFGDAYSATQLYISVSGKTASRSYDGSVFTAWRKTANAGANDDITSISGLTGPLRLGGDGVSDYDAVTLRQARNMGGGSGPTMNGIMNYGIGAFRLQDSRAFIASNEIPSDGQLLDRATYPDLWAYAQVHGAISDSSWVSTPENRGKYSTGNGTTTFRVPDRNGVQTGSIRALFARGDGGNLSNAGMIMESFLPNITGNISFHGAGPANNLQAGTVVSGVGGAFVNREGFTIPQYVRGVSILNSGANSLGAVELRASNSSPAYGRNNLRTDEVLPRNFSGVWVIRASGGFVAANTQWSVLNGDAALPGNNTSVLAGNLISDYQVNGVSEMKVSLQGVGVVGSKYAAQLSVFNKTKNITNTLIFDDVGDLTVPGSLVSNNIKPQSGNTVQIAGIVSTQGLYSAAGTGNGVLSTSPGNVNVVEMVNVNGAMPAGSWVGWTWYRWYNGYTRTGTVRSGNTDIAAYQVTIQQNSGGVNKDWQFKADGSLTGPGGVIQAAGSDRELKDNIVDAPEGSGRRIAAIKTRMFSWKSDGREDYGYIAQELQEIDEHYVFKSAATESNPEILNVSQNALISDLIGAVQELQLRVAQLSK